MIPQVFLFYNAQKRCKRKARRIIPESVWQNRKAALPRCFEDILQLIFQKYSLRMDLNQYILVGATIRSYISYMHDRDVLRFFADNGKILWESA